MNEWRSKEGLAIGCFILFSGLFVFFNLWARSLENHDYLRYAEIAREMVRSGEWVVPHFNGEVYIDKPPLLFWLIAILSSLYGAVTPLVARFPSAISAWLGVVLLLFWGKKVYGTLRSGFIAGAVLLSSYQYFSEGRMAKTDMLLCLFILLSLYFFYLGYRELGKREYLYYSLSFFFMGLGVLTKGPFGLFLPFFILSAFLIKERRWRMLISKRFILGYIILALTTLPWIFLFIHRVGLEKSMILVKETQILTRKAPLYFYVYQIWGQFFPWSLLLPFLFFYLWKQRKRLWHSNESFFLIWFVVIFVLLTLFQYKASRYLLPALPPLALMMSGMGKKRLLPFLIVCLFFVLIWQSVEFNRARKNISYSPGMVLAGELRPFSEKSTLSGYELDVSTVEEINFYLNPPLPVPILKETGGLSEQLKRRGGGLVLMPKEVYEKLRLPGDLSVVFLQEFRYKKGVLVLISS